MGLFNLDHLFHPKSIAVIGASDKKGSIGNAVMQNLFDGNFQGDILPVNPKYKDIHGVEAYASLSGIQSLIDLVIIAVPIAAVPDIILDAVEKRVKGAIILSAGGKEVGEKGRQIEARIQKSAQKGGVRIIGPNCLGMILPHNRLNASFAADMPKTGNLAFISQSGAICTAILDLAFKEKIGFSHFISIGSMLDVDFGDLIDYLGYDPTVKSILLYVENITHIRKFISAARAVSRVKPIIVLKAGRSAEGSKSAASHTGALTGEDAVYDAAFRRAGIIRVETIDELFDCAELMAKQSKPRGKRLGIITNGGGPGVMAIDALARHGMTPAVLDQKIFAALKAELPAFWSRNNPIDILGDASARRYQRTLEICIRSGQFDAILVMLAPQALTNPSEVAGIVIEQAKNAGIPVFTSWMGGRDVAKAMEMLNQAGIPTYETPERAIAAFVYMARYAMSLDLLNEIPPRTNRVIEMNRPAAGAIIWTALGQKQSLLSEVDSKAMLKAYGIHVNSTRTAHDVDEAVTVAEKMGFPVAMKVISPQISHKTEAKGVKLDLRNRDEVQTAFESIMASVKSYNPDASIEGVSIQTYIGNPDYELLLGVKRDENFGPVILFGTGGILTEIIKDRGIALPPLNLLLIKRLMEETRIYPLLKGYRNRPPADLTLLSEMILGLNQLVIDFPEISELDLNPVLIKDGTPHAVDARIFITPFPLKSPLHLVISPYPARYESDETTSKALNIKVRPIRPEDAELFITFFGALTPQTVYNRFFGYLKSLAPDMLSRLTQIDYDREMALVALSKEGDLEKMLGIARIIADPDGERAEFSVLVSDAFQGHGIGATLLEKLITIAKERAIQQIWGYVLKENVHMQHLGKKLGFTRTYLNEDGVYKMTLELNKKIADGRTNKE